MGSLNLDGSFIEKDVNSYRNIGNFIHRTDPVSPNPKEVVTKDYAPGVAGDQADVTASQLATLGASSHIKKTNSIDDSTTQLIALSGVVVATGAPELGLKSITQRSATHTGERIVIREETPGTLIDRQKGEGAFG